LQQCCDDLRGDFPRVQKTSIDKTSPVNFHSTFEQDNSRCDKLLLQRAAKLIFRHGATHQNNADVPLFCYASEECLDLPFLPTTSRSKAKEPAEFDEPVSEADETRLL
jgi:hypothetical protein